MKDRKTVLKAFAMLLLAVAFAGALSIARVSSADGAATNPPRLTKHVFPPNNPWNQDISKSPVDPNSENILANMEPDRPLHPDFGTTWQGEPNGIPYVVVPGTQPKVPVTFDYSDESDAGPYPIPPNPPIEGGPESNGDRHVLIIDKDNWMLYELSDVRIINGQWYATAGAVFNLESNALRPDHWTSADAAGLPIFPGLARYDEVVEDGAINHALRFTVPHTRRAYVYPARHYASHNTDPNFPPMGMRVRLKASVDISGFPPEAKVILTALKRYGMILADNGSPWFVSGAPDPRWNVNDLGSLRRIKGSDFEVVQMGEATTN